MLSKGCCPKTMLSIKDALEAVEYSITPHDLSLEKVLDELHYWGLAHRM